MIPIPQIDLYERSHLQDGVLALLCDLATGDLERPLTRIDADWEHIHTIISRSGLLGLTSRYLSHHPDADYPPASFREAIHATYRLSALRMAFHYRSVFQVLDSLNASGIDYMIVKGPAVAYSIYPDPSVRNFNDLDVIVRERDWQATHRLLTAMDFEQEENLPAPPPKFCPQNVAYETKYIHQQTGFKVEIHYDDIFNAGLAARDVEAIWRRAVTISIKDTPAKILSLEDQLIHLCIHAHYHGYTRLNWFSDIAFVMRNRKADIDWGRLFHIIETEAVSLPVYYSLYYLQLLLDVTVPPFVLDRLKPGRVLRWLHERYMPSEGVLSMQPMPRADFSFYFLPLYKRLIPDLLVMGRRREKLASLGYLLIPSRAWLRFYYRLDHEWQINLHYLLHPLKLLAVYLTETWVALRKGIYYEPRSEEAP